MMRKAYVHTQFRCSVFLKFFFNLWLAESMGKEAVGMESQFYNH